MRRDRLWRIHFSGTLWTDFIVGQKLKPTAPLSESDISEIIEMALSDHVSFDTIKQLHGVSADQVKSLMRTNLKAGSYRAWRKRICTFGSRRAYYK